MSNYSHRERGQSSSNARKIESTSVKIDPVMPESLLGDWWLILLISDAVSHPYDLPDSKLWTPTSIPSTTYGTLNQDITLSPTTLARLHDYDVWYRTSAHLEQGDKLRFCGLAGLADLWIDSQLVASSSNMYTDLVIEANATRKSEILIRFHSLTKALKCVSGRPRWRTKLVTSNAMRMYRQTLLGHMPGWCPSIHVVGPYRPVYHIRGADVIETCSLDTRMVGQRSTFSIRLAFLKLIHPEVQLRVRLDYHIILLDRVDEKTFKAEVTLDNIEAWWPHTHGEPKLYEIFLKGGDSELSLGKVGFRDLKVIHDTNGTDFRFSINGVPIFCRGACWTNASLGSLKSDRAAYQGWLALARDAGMNMIRVSGTMLYESKHLHDLCDEMGLLVWQDLMFANLDYPTEEPAFRESVLNEVKQLVDRLAGSPSLALICGGSEMAQQAVMLGLPRDRWVMPFFETFLKDFISSLKSDLIYVPNSPWGGPLPINVDAGISHYYGVGAYQRPLEDARRANVRFAAECLAFANLPSAKTLSCDSLLDSPHDPGATWNFHDTRDYYLEQLYMTDPRRLRAEDPERYLTLSQAVTADLMEAVFSEWRRPGSGCSGGLVWQLQDLNLCSGWGVIDSNGHPKSAWHGLRRVFAPIQVLISDEGVNGLNFHIINETAKPLPCSVQLICLSHASKPIIRAEVEATVQMRSSMSISSYTLCGSFFDINRSYRFGPAAHNVTIVSVVCSNSGNMLSQAVHFSQGRALPVEDININIEINTIDGQWLVSMMTNCFAQAVELNVPGYRSVDNWFHLPPLQKKVIRLMPLNDATPYPSGTVKALNGRKVHHFRGGS